MPPPTRALPEEVIEEILLRLPPHKPAHLVRASLVSKPWLALLSGARFRGRYHEFHRAPPLLGVFIQNPWNILEQEEHGELPFISTTKFPLRIPDDGSGHRKYAVWDCRHGRVLLGEKNAAPMKLAVWDPMTGHSRELREPGCMVVEHESGHLGAAVLCTVSGCDHRGCHDGPSRVVFFSLHHVGSRFLAQACMSLPEKTTTDCSASLHPSGEWGKPCSALPIDSLGFIEPRPPVLVQDAIHFMLMYAHGYGEEDSIVHAQILKYDLSSNCLSLIHAPRRDARHYDGNSILMALEDGTLGFAYWKRLRLYIWSRQIVGSDGVAAWTRRRVISLKNIPPINVQQKGFITMEGSVEGRDIIFVSTDLGIYKINLKTLRRKKIWEAEDCNALVPYMSFYNPTTRYGQRLV